MQVEPDWVSEKRFAEYLEVAGGDRDVASELYVWNARVSSALFELIHHVEVLMRNAVIRELTARGSGPNMPPGTPWVQNAARIAEVEKRVRSNRKSATEARIYAGLTFGFWKSMFGVEYDELWRHALQYAFPNSRGDRKIIASHLESVNDLRNRIAHHGSLIERDTRVEANKLLRLAHWIDADAAEWLRSIEQATTVTGQRPIKPPRNVVVVAAEDAWRLYNERKRYAYVFQAARSIQVVDFVAFYAGQEIKPVVAKILRHFEAVDWNRGNSRRLMRSDDPEEQAVGHVIGASMGDGWTQSTYQVFLLSAPDDARTVTLPAAVDHSRRGRGSAFVRAHRYVALSTLQSASDTADLRS